MLSKPDIHWWTVGFGSKWNNGLRRELAVDRQYITIEQAWTGSNTGEPAMQNKCMCLPHKFLHEYILQFLSVSVYFPCRVCIIISFIILFVNTIILFPIFFFHPYWLRSRSPVSNLNLAFGRRFDRDVPENIFLPTNGNVERGRRVGAINMEILTCLCRKSGIEPIRHFPEGTATRPLPSSLRR